MIDILYTENIEPLVPPYTDLICSFVSTQEISKALAYRRWQDKQAYLLSKWLVAAGLRKYGHSRELLKNLGYTEFQRPYIPGVDFDFNISHSGEFVVCAFSAGHRVGIDIEQIQPVNLKDFETILNNADKEIINKSDDPYATFFRIWSAKEAILKADGCGLINDVYMLKVDEDKGIFNDKVYFLKDLSIHSGYSCCLASLHPVANINIEKITLPELDQFFK
jgi:4'-phosphopantetheinyl transferase